MTSRARRYSPLAKCRRALGYSQERLAEELGVDRTTVARWERGETEPQPENRPMIARILQLDLAELAELLTIRPVNAPDFPDVTTLSRELIDYPQLDHAKRKIGHLLQAERIFGGTQVANLAYDVAATFDQRIRVAGIRHGLERDTYSIAAELYEISGWFFVDAAKVDSVRTANRHAMHYCALAGDRSMEMLVTQNMSMHSVEIGQVSEGLTLARGMLDRGLSPRLGAMFHMREARALAARGDTGAKREFAKSRALYQDGARDSDPYWSWWLDDAQMLVQEGCLYSDLGEWERAITAFRAHLDEVTRPGSPGVPIFEHALCLADMAYAMTNLGAWRDVEAVSMELLANITDVPPRAHLSVQQFAQVVNRDSRAPAPVCDVVRALTTHPEYLAVTSV